MDTLSEWMSNVDFLGTPLLDANSFGQLILRFFINFVIVTSIIHFFYYPKSRRRDYYFRKSYDEAIKGDFKMGIAWTLTNWANIKTGNEALKMREEAQKIWNDFLFNRFE